MGSTSRSSAPARAACIGWNRWSRSSDREGRVGYGPVKAADVEACSSRLLEGGKHPLCLGLVEDIPWLKHQTRLTFARGGIIDPLSLDDYRAHGGYKGLAKALAIGPEAIVEEVVKSGLRGRGGAGFPTGIKWRTVAATPPQQKYIVCNADEGDSGTFADRMIMEGDPFVLIEGMTIAGLAVGATNGYIYVRSEYPARRSRRWRSRSARRRAACSARSRRLDIRLRHRGARRRRRLCLRRGDLAAREPRGQARRGARQAAAPAHNGLFGKPTVINNVLSLAAVPFILADGGEPTIAISAWAVRAAPCRSSSPAISSMAGCSRPPSASRLGELVDDIGGGTRSGRPVRAVQVGGPLGAYFPRALFDTPFDYEAFAAADGLIGHGGIVVFDDTVDMAQAGPLRHGVLRHRVLRQVHALPHRLDPRRRAGRPDHRRRGRARTICAARRSLRHHEVRFALRLGRVHPYPVMSALTHFPEDFGAAPKRLRAANEEHAMSLVQEIDYGTPRSTAEKTVTLTIDGVAVTVPEGTSVMRAAMEHGHEIPKLCATDMLEAFGSCRLCLVEIEGRNGTPASCTTPVAEGMVVHTQTERLKRPAPGRDGALHLRPSARLPDLLGQRRLRAAGHGRRGRPARGALRL